MCCHTMADGATVHTLPARQVREALRYFVLHNTTIVACGEKSVSSVIDGQVVCSVRTVGLPAVEKTKCIVLK